MGKQKIYNGYRPYIKWYNKFSLLALNMFKWEGLPNSIKSRHIEKALFEYGMAFIYHDKDIGLVCYGATPSGNFNSHGEPTQIFVHKHNGGITKLVSEGVLIRNNDLAIPTEYEVIDYARKMKEVEMSIDLNIKQQRFPYFIESNPNNRFSLEQAFKQKEDGTPVIFANKNLGLESLNVLALDTPYVVDKLNQYKYELEREVLTTFGINNTFEKKERLLTDEINSNNDFIDRNVDIMFDCRLEGIKEIKAKFGKEFKVIKKNDVNVSRETLEKKEGEKDV